MFPLKMFYRLHDIVILIFIILYFNSIMNVSSQEIQTGNPGSKAIEVQHRKGNPGSKAIEVQHGKGNPGSKAIEVQHRKGNPGSKAIEVQHGKGNPGSKAIEVQHGKEKRGNVVQIISLGVFFEQHTDEIQEAFKFAMSQYSTYVNRSKLDFKLNVDVINTADVFKLSRLICNHFARGVISLLGAVAPDSFETLHSYTNTFQVPFVTPWFPEKVLPTTSGYIDYALSMRPDYHKAVIDTITYYQWKAVIYIYDSQDGLLRLQQLYQSLPPGKAPFQITNVKRVTKAIEVVTFLLSLETIDRWSNKYVVLDSGSQLAKEALILHVREVQLGRRNYHYFLSGLVFDEHWDENVTEFGAVNVTGLQVIDFSRTFVQKVSEMWNRTNISANSALMYDTVHVLVDGILRMIRKRPDFLLRHHRRNASNMINCNPHSQVAPYELGEKVSRMIKRTELEGLTGSIRFDEKGHRKNFTLQVVEMTYKKKIVKIGTWYDYKGLIPIDSSKSPVVKSFGEYNRNHTYIITTIAERPYVYEVKTYNEQAGKLRGFCLDLTRLVMDKLDLKYHVRIVKDEKYGAINTKAVGGWDGMVGELVRQEADLAIAPLAVTLERETVVDFSKPFLSFDFAIKEAYPSLGTIFTFLRPLSMELWLSIVGSFFGVSLSLFIVSRFSPSEWRIVTLTESHTTDDNEVATTRTTVVNEFSFGNAIWFAFGCLMQQGCNITPRSTSGKIVCFVWWFFVLILVSMYTANMASHFTITRISEPFLTYSRVTACPEDEAPRRKKEGIWVGFLSTPGFMSPARTKRACEMMLSVTQSGVKDFAVAFPKGSKLRDGVNLALQALKDDGDLQALVRKWFIDTKCNTDVQIQGVQLTLSQMAGALYILVAGLIMAMIVSLCEFIINGCSEARAANISIRRALISRMIRPDQPASPSSDEAQEDLEDQDNMDWNRGAYGVQYYASNNPAQEDLPERYTPP